MNCASVSAELTDEAGPLPTTLASLLYSHGWDYVVAMLSVIKLLQRAQEKAGTMAE